MEKSGLSHHNPNVYTPTIDELKALIDWKPTFYRITTVSNGENLSESSSSSSLDESSDDESTKRKIEIKSNPIKKFKTDAESQQETPQRNDEISKSQQLIKHTTRRNDHLYINPGMPAKDIRNKLLRTENPENPPPTSTKVCIYKNFHMKF